MTAENVKSDGGVLDGAGEGADLIERTGESNEAIARDAAIGGLDADDAAESGGLTDRAAGIGAEREGALERSDGGRRAAAAAAGDAFEIPGIISFLEGGVFAGGAHRELVHVEFAEKDGAGGAQARDDGGVVGGNEI